MASEIKLMSGHTNSLVTTGDLNVNFIADQRRRLAGFPTALFGPFMNFDMPTGQAGKSLLDYVMTLRGGGLTLSGAKLVKGLNTDHPAVVATYGGGASTLFSPGVLRNSPKARAKGPRRVVLERVLTAIRGAVPGTTVRVQTKKLNNREIKRAIKAARARGVQVVVKVKKRTKITLILAERTSGFASVSLRTGTPLIAKMPSRKSALVISSDAATYEASSRVFMARH